MSFNLPRREKIFLDEEPRYKMEIHLVVNGVLYEGTQVTVYPRYDYGDEYADIIQAPEWGTALVDEGGNEIGELFSPYEDIWEYDLGDEKCKMRDAGSVEDLKELATGMTTNNPPVVYFSLGEVEENMEYAR